MMTNQNITDRDFFRQTLFDQILPFVSKPGRYIGNEVNMIRKNLDEVDLRVALVFPDVYEVGMSYLGFPILYHILNQQPGIYAERIFAPWHDFQEQMQSRHFPPVSLETFTPLHQFDIVGFTLQYELHITTILNLLHLSDLPQYARDRDDFPFIIAGGPSSYNPEPLADFFDAIFIGDAEEAIVEIADCVREAKRAHSRRKETLQLLSRIQGMYIPEFYKPDYDSSGSFTGVQVREPSAPRRIRTRIVSSLDNRFYPHKPLVPVISTTHDRVALEIARGCTRGCRFCNAGFIYRPVRERAVTDLVTQAIQNIDSTGYDEVSLVSLSTSDYSQMEQLLTALHEKLSHRMVNISFPSLRPECFTPQIARFARDVRKSGLTLAPEAGSDRLRRVINKSTTTEQLLQAVDLAFREGWRLVKLYFMIGLPEETEEDMDAIVRLLHDISALARHHHNREINASISPFVPKAFTPFQWMAQDSMQTIEQKIEFLQSRVRFRNVKLSWRPAQVAVVEGILARGDRRMSQVIKRAWELGANLEGWSECFDFQRWMQACRECHVDVDRILHGYSPDQPLPWDHIEKGVTKKYLRSELAASLGQNVTPDCRTDTCHECGLMGQSACQDIIQHTSQQKFESEPEAEPAQKTGEEKIIRVQYRRGPEVKFLSHLDMIRLLNRALRRANVPLAYSQGFNPKPKMSFGPPLATGYTSEAEFVDIHVLFRDDFDFAEAIAVQLPQGIEILRGKILEKRGISLSALINRVDYEVRFPAGDSEPGIEEKMHEIMKQSQIYLERKKEGRAALRLDVRPFLLAMNSIAGGFAFSAKLDNGHTVNVDEVVGMLLSRDYPHLKTIQVHRAGLYVQDGDVIKSPMDYQ